MVPPIACETSACGQILGAIGPRPCSNLLRACDNSASEACPLWPGQPTHWGVPDPTTARGNEAEIWLAFADIFRIDPAAVEIVPRLVAQIANEMTFALEEQVGSPQDMDIAMKLGFNWPLGPVEFTELIGVDRAVELLERLQATNGEAYRPAPGLLAAARGS